MTSKCASGAGSLRSTDCCAPNNSVGCVAVTIEGVGDGWF